MSKHTPGPWAVVEHDHAICIRTESPSKTKYGASRYAAIGGFDRNDRAQLEEARANARLIAAAPELLAVSDNWEVSEKEDGIWLIIRGTGTTGRGAFRVARPGSRTIAVQVLRLLDADRRAAIAKATGETP